MAKKKIKETLSKREKEFLADAREVMKEDLEDNYKNLIEYYEIANANYEYRVTTTLEQFKNDLDKEINKIFLISEIKELSTFVQHTNLLQVAIRLREVFKLEKDSLIEELNLNVDEMIQEDLECIIENTKYSCTPRSLDIFATELMKKKYKIKDRAFAVAMKELDELFQVILEQTRELEAYAMESVVLVNDHLRNSKYFDSNMENISIKKTDRLREATICGYKVETYTFGCYITRKIDSDINREEMEKQSNEMKQLVGEYALIHTDDIKLSDGRKLKWNGDKFNIDNSTITDRFYSYKDLNGLAVDLGYRLDRSNGDHAIYVKQGEGNVVIPQKVLGKGLQLKILKDLKVI